MMRWLRKLREHNDDDDKMNIEIKEHNKIKKTWKVTQKKRTKEKRWKDEKAYGVMDKNHATWRMGYSNTSGARTAFLSAHTLKIRPTKRTLKSH